MAECDFRVQCGRCTGDARYNCTVVWAATAAAYGVAAIGINLQMYYQGKEAPLIRNVLLLWSIAYYERVVGSLILCMHLDKHIPPVVLEMLWHSCWLWGCAALTLFMVKLSVAAGNIRRMGKITRRASLVDVVGKVGTCLCTEGCSKRFNSTIPISTFWCIVFIVLSIVDGLRSNWPQQGVQWFVWASCSLYLMVTNWVTGSYIIAKLKMSSPEPSQHSSSHSDAKGGQSRGSREQTRDSSRDSRDERGNASSSGVKDVGRGSAHRNTSPQYSLKTNSGTENTIGQKKRVVTRKLLVYVLYAIKYGLLAYTLVLIALGLTYVAFSAYVSLLTSTVIMAGLQFGMLCMGIVIQLAVYWTGMTSASISRDAAANREKLELVSMRIKKRKGQRVGSPTSGANAGPSYAISFSKEQKQKTVSAKQTDPDGESMRNMINNPEFTNTAEPGDIARDGGADDGGGEDDDHKCA